MARGSSFDECARFERLHSRTRAMRDSSRTSSGWALHVRFLCMLATLQAVVLFRFLLAPPVVFARRHVCNAL